MKKVLLIDNYDSFTYNLVHYLEALHCEVVVKRNDAFTLQEVNAYNNLILSPGPGIPDEAGLLKALLTVYAPYKHILGICLGMQAIAEVFGGTLINLSQPCHGVATDIYPMVTNESLFAGLEDPFKAGRYHSWAVSPSLPACLEATSVDAAGCIMSLRHRQYAVKGLQYHPESILTPCGKKILANWLHECREEVPVSL